MKSFKLFVAVPVWGETYVNTFLNTSLPTLMASGNFPYIIKNYALQFCIYTSEADEKIISNHPLIQVLKSNAELIIHVLRIPKRNQFNDEHSFRQAFYDLKSNSYKDNMQRAGFCIEYTPVLVSLNADIIFSDIFLSESLKLLSSGKKVIEVVGPRGKAKEIQTALHKYSKEDGSISISAHDLLNLWIDNIHPLLSIHYWNGNSEHFNCSHLMWPTKNGKGWLARCFYLYPIILVHPQKQVVFSGTIDKDMVTNCGYSKKDVAVITEQSKMFCCELSEEEKFVGAFGVRGNYTDIAQMYALHGDAYNLFLLDHIIMLASDVSAKGWDELKDESEIVVSNIRKKMKSQLSLVMKLQNLGHKIVNLLSR